MLLNVVLKLVLIVCVISAGKIPDYIHVCKRSDADVAKCVKSSIEHIRPRLLKGIPELDVPAIEPLHIKEIVVSRGERPSNFRLILKSIDVYGASNFQLTKLKIDVPALTFRVGVTLPVLKMVGDYDVNARVLVVPINGKGRFTANATDCSAVGTLRGALKDVGGKKYMYFTDLDMKLNIGDYKIHLDGSDPVINQAGNEVLNQNRKDFINIAKPFIQSKASEVLLLVANKIVKNFSFDEVFPL